jgi:dihydropteroate synthase
MLKSKELKQLAFWGFLKVDLAEVDNGVGVLRNHDVASEVDFILREDSEGMGLRGHGFSCGKD